MAVLLDDHLLGRAFNDVLTEADLDAIDEDAIATTGCWYYRLCQAVASPAISGQLSGPFAATSPSHRKAALDLLLVLPEEIEVVPLRHLAPSMATLVQRHRLNLLSLEALAAARWLRATILLDRTNASRNLLAACEAEGVEVLVV